MNDCIDLLRPALNALSDEYEIQPDGQTCTIITPFELPNGDALRLYIRHNRGDLYYIRDYGETHAFLRLHGVNPAAGSRQERLDHIQERFDLKEVSDEICLQASADTLGIRLGDAIQAIFAVSYNIYTHKSQDPTQFATQVEAFLTDEGYDYKTNYSIEGENQKREFDFRINHREPAVLLDTIHANDQSYLGTQADSVMVNSYEISDLEYEHGVIIDDVQGIDNDEILAPVNRSLDHFFTWTDKNAIVETIPPSIN